MDVFSVDPKSRMFDLGIIIRFIFFPGAQIYGCWSSRAGIDWSYVFLDKHGVVSLLLDK
jgi:hypothetical protein